MDSRTITQLAVEAGAGIGSSGRWLVTQDELERFAALIAAAVKEEDARAWQKATKEIIDRTVAPDMYANAMDMLHAAIRASIKEGK